MRTHCTLETHVHGFLCERFVPIFVDVAYQRESSGGYGYVRHTQ